MKVWLEKRDLVGLVARRVNRDVESVGEIVDATLEAIYEALKRGEPVSLRHFGSFYVRPEPDAWVFKFNPSQRLRKCGWSSTYRGDVQPAMASFEETYPHVARWVKEYGWIEVGHDDMSRSWIRALDEGGLIWEGGDASKPVDAALQELEEALSEWMREELEE